MVAVPGQIEVLPEIVHIGGTQLGIPADTEPVLELPPIDKPGVLSDWL